MTEYNFMDDLYYEETPAIIDPADAQALLEQPGEIVTYEDENGDLVTYESEPIVEIGGQKDWEPDDTLIAQARIDSESAPTPFRDPVDQAIIQAGR